MSWKRPARHSSITRAEKPSGTMRERRMFTKRSSAQATPSTDSSPMNTIVTPPCLK